MTTRTWPYGTRKTGTVKFIVNRSRVSLLVVEDSDDPKEAYLLLDGPGHFGGLEEGKPVTIEFTFGGPTGGYWEVVREKA